MKTHARASERGAALLLAITVTVAVLAVGIALVTMSTNELTASKAHGDTVTLRNLAEAGIERAMDQLNRNPTWRCTNPNDAAFNNAPVTAQVNGVQRTLGTFTVEPVQELGGDFVQITARGFYPNAGAPNAQSKRIRLTAYKKWGTPFSAAAFGRVGVPLANGETDSYDSRKGSYFGQTPGKKGDIRTDSTDPASITILNNGRCNGRVMYGPGTNLNNVTLDPNRIDTGIANDPQKIMAAPSTAVMPDVVVPSTAWPISWINGGSNQITNNLSIPAGTWVCDSINLTGSDTVWTNGKVVLYVRGNVSIGGNGIVNNGDSSGGVAKPENLLIYCTNACTSVAISGNGYLAAAVYAPKADIVLNGAGTDGEVFGALAGKKVSFNGNGTVLHYDEALQSVKGVVIGYRARTWEES